MRQYMDNGYTLLISILSGLFGALISAFLSFKVRVIAQNKIKKDLEHRIAYVYVSQLSFLVAANAWLQSFFEKIEAQVDTPIPENEFTFSHAISIIFEDMIRENNSHSYENIVGFEGLVELHIDNLTKTYLTFEQQAELPKDALIFYQRYEKKLKNVVVIIKQFSSYLSNKEQFLKLDAIQIYQAIENIKLFLDSAGLLRTAMIMFGKINQAEANLMLEQQLQTIEKDILIAGENKVQLSKARQFLIREGAIKK